MYDSRLSRHYHIWNDEFSERPERLTEPYTVCQKYKLIERCKEIKVLHTSSDFIWDFRKLPFPSLLGKYFIKIGKIRLSAKVHEIGKIKAIFGLGMSPI